MPDHLYTTRAATIEDAGVIARFNLAMADETEGLTLDPSTLLAGVKRVFDEPSHGRYFVAESTGIGVVACLLVTHEWSDWRNGQIWWIQSVYVDPEHRRRGLFKKLYHTVRAMGGQTSGVCGYRLYVERDNLAAQQTYKAIGMSRTPYLVYESIAASTV